MANNSGTQQIVIPPFSRALSSDIDRLQQIVNASRANLAGTPLAEYLQSRAGFGQTGSLSVIDGEPGVTGFPALPAVVNRGGFCNFDDTSQVTIEPMVLTAYLPTDPNKGPDDSDYVIVEDLGATRPVFPFVPYGAGAGNYRKDLIVVRVSGAQDTVTGSREIFNPTTQKFSSQNVTVGIDTQLAYDYIIGAGNAPLDPSLFPADGIVMCVVIVPGGATGFDDCAIFDTRPLAADMVEAPGQPRNVITDHNIRAFEYPTGSVNPSRKMTGTFRFVSVYNDARGSNWLPFGGGGVIDSGDLVADYSQVHELYGDVSDGAVSQSSTVVGSVRNIWAVVMPYSLPRWNKYLPGKIDGRRVRSSFNGVLGAAIDGGITGTIAATGRYASYSVRLPAMFSDTTRYEGAVLCTTYTDDVLTDTPVLVRDGVQEFLADTPGSEEPYFGLESGGTGGVSGPLYDTSHFPVSVAGNDITILNTVEYYPGVAYDVQFSGVVARDNTINPGQTGRRVLVRVGDVQTSYVVASGNLVTNSFAAPALDEYAFSCSLKVESQFTTLQKLEVFLMAWNGAAFELPTVFNTLSVTVQRVYLY